jgi:hypothetical protein
MNILRFLSPFNITHRFTHLFWLGDLNYRVELPTWVRSIHPGPELQGTEASYSQLRADRHRDTRTHRGSRLFPQQSLGLSFSSLLLTSARAPCPHSHYCSGHPVCQLQPLRCQTRSRLGTSIRTSLFISPSRGHRPA